MKKIHILLFTVLFISTGKIKAQAVTDLLNFNGTNGEYPYGGLTLSGNNLYGMVGYGAANNAGSIFTLKTNGTGYRDLHDFIGAAGGATPLGDLLMAGNKFYGMTGDGGASFDGTIFSIDTDGSDFRTLFSFAGRTTGAEPYGALILSGTQLFGMTYTAGTSDEGTIFSVDTNGNNFKVLLDFNDTNGAYPFGSLTRIGNVLYGMSSSSAGGGDIFSIDSDGKGFRDLYDFNCTTGCGPLGTLLLLGNKFYGVTYAGGFLNYGTIFSIDTNGSGYVKFHDFAGDALPIYGGLSYSNGLLYGMASSGGAGGYGVVFSIDTDGSGYSDIALFNKTDGAYPYSVTVALDGNRMFGMTQRGGVYDSGVVFGYSFCSIGINVSSANPVRCHGDSDGSAIAAGITGASPYTYFWSTIPAQFTATCTGLSAGSYRVTVTDNNGCADTASIVITQPDVIGDSMSSMCATCCNCKGYTRDSAFGGTSPYTYSWSNGRTNDTLHSLVGGTYTCTVTDARGCTKTDSVIVTEGEHLSPGSSNITCYGDNDGTATAEVLGNYDYSWSPGGQTTATITGLSAGSYMVTATNHDTVGCISTYNFIIIEPPLLQTSLSVNSGCNGGAGGSAVLSVSGGTPGYSYVWMPAGGNGSSANGLSAGSYTVTVSDANGCTSSAVFSITVPLSPLSVSTYEESCSSFGTIFSSVSGGTPPYTYFWSYSYFGTPNNLSSVQVDIDCGGNNSSNLTVTDNNGCTASGSGSIDPPSQLQHWTTTNSCFGGNNGSVTLDWCGGYSFPPQYTYTLNPTGQVFTTTSPYAIPGLAAGTYTITFYLGGCIGSQENINFTITQTSALSVTTNTTLTSCTLGGTASATVSGGTSPYTYSWSGGGGTGSSTTVLGAGTYTITITDNNDCNTTSSVIISPPPLLQDSINSSCATCCNCKGTTHVYVWGGTPPYTYSWSNGRTNDTLVGLASGSYTATVTDSNGCVVMDTVFVHKGSEVIASQTNILCNGQSNGSATIIVAGNYSYSWSPGGETTSSINGLSAGGYNVTITNNDTAGCSATYSFNITQPQPLMVETFSPTCSSGGEITSSVSGGTLPYTYAWIGGIFGDSGTSVYPNPTCINNFRGATLTVSDNNGCTAFSGTWAYLPPISQLDIISGTDVSCFGENNGSIYVHGCGGQMGIGYTFTLSPTGQVVNTDSNYTFTNLAPGSYDIGFYFGNCGALISVPVTITQPPALSITADTINASPGNCDGSAWATVSGGAAPYTYSWTGGLTTDTIYNQCAGYYCCTITDASGCIDSVCTNIETSTATNEVKGEKEKVKVYPNPNEGIFIIQMVNGELSVVNDEIQVYNVLGQQVYSQFTIHNSPFTIDLSSQPNGVYFYRVVMESGEPMGDGKIIINR